MNDQLEKRLIEDLEKSGFGSEMKALRAFLSYGWVATGFANYHDLDHEETRELDLQAATVEWENSASGKELLVGFYIIAEVKKSETPWIVFKEKPGLFASDSWNNLVYTKNLPCEPRQLVEPLSRHCIFTELKWRAHGIHEAFKRPNSHSRWYPAFVKVSKAAETFYKKCFADSEERLQEPTQAPDRDIQFKFFKPIVILDGVLIAASLTKLGEISLEEIKYAPLEFAFQSRNYRKGNYLVDIVTLGGLQEYIDICDDRHVAVYEYLKSLA